MISKTIDATQMRLINRSAILEYIRLNSPTSRTAIAQSLGVSMPTAARIVNDLFEDNLIVDAGRTHRGQGRRRDLVAYNTDACSVIGVDLGGTNLYGALANIGGEVLHEVTVKHHGSSGEETVDLVITIIENLLHHEVATSPIRGIAVGAPGVTHASGGVVEWAPSLNWRDFPLRNRIQDHFQLPTFVENDVNLAVLGEHWFGAGRDFNNLILIGMGTGVGAGLIIDGALYRGHSNASGEVGYMAPDTEALRQRYESFGALESIISGTGIKTRARKWLDGSDGPEGLDARAVFARASAGESWANQIIEETIDYLALAIANINALLDLELVVLSGGLACQADTLIDGIYQRIEGVIPRIPSIVASQLGRTATVMGAIVLVIHATDDYCVVRTLS